jgi:hypothetical protein
MSFVVTDTTCTLPKPIVNPTVVKFVVENTNVVGWNNTCVITTAFELQNDDFLFTLPKFNMDAGYVGALLLRMVVPSTMEVASFVQYCDIDEGTTALASATSTVTSAMPMPFALLSQDSAAGFTDVTYISDMAWGNSANPALIAAQTYGVVVLAGGSRASRAYCMGEKCGANCAGDAQQAVEAPQRCDAFCHGQACETSATELAWHQTTPCSGWETCHCELFGAPYIPDRTAASAICNANIGWCTFDRRTSQCTRKLSTPIKVDIPLIGAFAGLGWWGIELAGATLNASSIVAFEWPGALAVFCAVVIEHRRTLCVQHRQQMPSTFLGIPRGARQTVVGVPTPSANNSALVVNAVNGLTCREIYLQQSDEGEGVCVPMPRLPDADANAAGCSLSYETTTTATTRLTTGGRVLPTPVGPNHRPIDDNSTSNVGVFWFIVIIGFVLVLRIMSEVFTKGCLPRTKSPRSKKPMPPAYTSV